MPFKEKPLGPLSLCSPRRLKFVWLFQQTLGNKKAMLEQVMTAEQYRERVIAEADYSRRAIAQEFENEYDLGRELRSP